MLKMRVDVEKRRQLWWAFFDLWLDSELLAYDYRYIVRVMLESGYSLAGLQAICRYEVAPAVFTNLYNIFPGGVWGAFDREWLKDAIRANVERQERSRLFGRWVRSRLGQRLLLLTWRLKRPGKLTAAYS
jgi:hypothetical protein